MSKRIIVPIIILLLLGGLWLWSSDRSPTETRSTNNRSASQDREPEPTSSESPSNPDLPRTVLLKVPFTPQAPTANWDELHNEACEEASALMAHYYFNKPEFTNERIPAAQAEQEISKLTEWQQKNLGYYLSITTEEAQRMIEEVYGLQTKILENYTEQDLKQELAEGRLIIFPANGQKLDNPNFRSPGPIYHMLVIKGYDQGGFITNDPGTRNGFSYSYTFATLRDAGGDYSHDSKVVNPSPKLAISVWK